MTTLQYPIFEMYLQEYFLILFCSVFLLGFFFGCGVSLIVALGLIIHARNIMGTPGQRTYMETMFPLYRSVKRPNTLSMSLCNILEIYTFHFQVLWVCSFAHGHVRC